MCGRPVDTTRLSRTPGDGTISITSIMIAIVLAVLAVAVPARLVHDMGTLGDLFSILALPITLAVFYTARRLYLRERHAKESILREKDARGKKHVMDTIDLCRTLVLAIMRSDKSDLATINMPMLRYVAADIGMLMAQYGHVFGDEGGLFAERVRELVLGALEEGRHCSNATLSNIDSKLLALKSVLLNIDDLSLVNRRTSDAGFGNPVL